MKIIKGALTSLASRGYITLQVPQVVLNSSKKFEVETEEIPDNWIVVLRRGCPVAGQEQGHSFLTKIGWEVNKDKIKEAYMNAEFQRGSWEKFELYVEDHFKEVKEKTKRRIRLLEKKVKQLKSVYLTLI